MSTKLSLKPVSVLDGQAEWALLQTLPAENGFLNDGYGIGLDDFPDWLLSKVKEANSINLAEGRVPQQFYWLVLSENGVDKPIGFGKLRTQLTPYLLNNGGNIGYGISIDHRGKGYAKPFLSLLLDKAKAKGLDMVLLTVNSDNPASYKAVEINGGILYKEMDGQRWYWVYV